jgi:hypothetical protein
MVSKYQMRLALYNPLLVYFPAIVLPLTFYFERSNGKHCFNRNLFASKIMIYGSTIMEK